MSDISKIFKTTIKAIKLNSNIKVDPNQELNLKQVRKKKSTISNEALDIVKNVSKLRDFLINNKSSYIQPKFVSFRIFDYFNNFILKKMIALKLLGK